MIALKSFTAKAMGMHEGVAALRPLKKLTMLSICQGGGALSDRALAAIQELPALQSLSFGGCTDDTTRFTNTALLKLIDALPALKTVSLRQKYLFRPLFRWEIRKRHSRLAFEAG